MYLPLDRILEQAGTLRGLAVPREYGAGDAVRAQPQSGGEADGRARPTR
jgi:hypothetical protein